MAPRAGSRCLLAACALALLRPAQYFQVCAEEQAPAESDAPKVEINMEGAKVEVEVEAPAEGNGEAEMDPATFAESAKELQDKLAQLTALLDAKGDDVDPQFQERLVGLKEQISKLNLGGLQGNDGGGIGELVGGCAALAMRRAGMSKPSTMSQMRRIASGKLSQSQAAELELMRMITVCIYEMSTEELQLFKAGKLSILPSGMALKAAEQEAKQQVVDMEADMFSEVQTVAKGLIEQMGGEQKDSGLPMTYGVLAAVPLLCIFAFLGKKFMDMQKREEGRKDKSKKKKDK